jgi:hypothetical protein
MGVVVEFPHLNFNFLTSRQYQSMFKDLSLIIHGALDAAYQKLFNGTLSDLVSIITSESLSPEEKLHNYNEHLSRNLKEVSWACSTEEGKELLQLYQANKLRFGWSYALTAKPNEQGGLTIRLFITLDLFDNTLDMGPIETMGCQLSRISIDDVSVAEKLSNERCSKLLQALQ